jgi:hypothetical protein
MGIFCGARKSFLEFSLRLRILAEPFLFATGNTPRAIKRYEMFMPGNGSYNLRKEIPVIDYYPVYLINMLMKRK